MPLLLPINVERAARYICVVPQAHGQTCGAKFFAGQEALYERHVIGCSARNEEHERALSLRNRLGIFGGDRVDVELEDWVARHRRALLEGRKKL